MHVVLLQGPVVKDTLQQTGGQAQAVSTAVKKDSMLISPSPRACPSQSCKQQPSKTYSKQMRLTCLIARSVLCLPLLLSVVCMLLGA